MQSTTMDEPPPPLSVSDPNFVVLNDEYFERPTPTPTPSNPQHNTTLPSYPPSSFTYFPRLPTELRLLIWRHCLPQSTNRFIRLIPARALKEYPLGGNERRKGSRKSNVVDMEIPVEHDKLYTKTNTLGNIISGYPYIVLGVPHDNHWCSVLLRVNRESRCAGYLSRYRLPIEVMVVDPGPGPGPGQGSSYHLVPMHIDPDTDIIQLGGFHRLVKFDPLVIFHFLHDTVAADPQGKGLASLGISSNQLASLVATARSEKSSLHPAVIRTLNKYFTSGLKTFYNVMLFPPGYHLFLSRHRTRNRSCDSFELHGRAVPKIGQRWMERTVECKILPVDPRPGIDYPLSCMYLYTDPRYTIYLWYHLLAEFGITVLPKPPMQIFHLLAGETSGLFHSDKIYSRRSVSRREFIDGLKYKSTTWWASDEGPGMSVQFRSRPLDEEFWSCCAQLHPVCGAWVFDGDAFGTIPYDPDDPGQATDEGLRSRYLSQRVPGFIKSQEVDMRGIPRPRLLVFRFNRE